MGTSLRVGDTSHFLLVLRVRSVARTFRTGSVRNVKEVFARCVCGRTKWIRYEHVKGSRVKSCGCLNYSLRCADPYERAARRVLAYIRGSARARKLVFDLELVDIRAVVFDLCFYCACAPVRQLEPTPRPYAEQTPMCHGIDRVRSDGGYTKDNIVPCCWRCNMMKFDAPVVDFLAHAARITARTAEIEAQLKQKGII